MSAAMKLSAFYPIVPDVAWLQRVAPLGIGCVQLRLKDVSAVQVRHAIREALVICQDHDVELIVNDYWREALEHGARVVHLGQEDLATADVAAIHASGCYLGVSTHSEAELAVALAAKPAYVALGPIYETKLKAMTWQPQGLARIGQWKRLAAGVPLVAIGGLTLERAAGAFDAGADSLAVITDFLTHPEPELRVRQWVALMVNLLARRVQGSSAGPV
jgi:thiamine-phosphate pyrophosphorylase